MFGTILVSIGTFFQEISDSIGKNKVKTHEESLYTMGFLSLFWGTIFFAIIGVLKNDAFIFSFSSLPTFSARVFLEIIQLYVSVLAIVKADRSTFGFVRTITIPLLLIVDFGLGYNISMSAVIGVAIIIIAMCLIFLNKGIKKKGMGWVIFSAINAVITISLFKYDITHFNSVVAEQLLINFILLISFSVMAIVIGRENPFSFLKKPVFLLQSASIGFGGVIESFGYNYGAASVMTAVKRSSAIFWSFLSGKLYFKEKHVLVKMAVFSLLLAGIMFLSI